MVSLPDFKMSRFLLLIATFLTLTKYSDEFQTKSRNVAFAGLHAIQSDEEWTVIIGGPHQTQMRGEAINFGRPISADMAFKVPDDNAWIIGANDGGHLKMVKIAINDENTYDWIAAKYTNYLEKNPSCNLKSFKISCWNDANDISCNSIRHCRNTYGVKLVAKKEKPVSTYRCWLMSARLLLRPADQIVPMGQDCHASNPW